MSFNRAPADFAHLNALLELINSSVQEIVSTYNAKGHDVLTLDSVDLGPFDSPENTPPTVTKAIQIVEGACAQLCATIAPPGLVVSNVGVLIVVVYLLLFIHSHCRKRTVYVCNYSNWKVCRLILSSTSVP